MDCPSDRCDGELRFLHSYDAGRAGRTIERKCEACGRKYVHAEMLVGQVDKRGTGAYATARKLRKRKTPINLDEQ